VLNFTLQNCFVHWNVFTLWELFIGILIALHSDLKPENILLDYTGHIALCDFGLCKLNMKDGNKTNTFCGTPEYLAPEVLIGKGYTKSVDWWTLGILLYEMIGGLPPFYDENVNVMYNKILQEKLTFHDFMSDAVIDILSKVLVYLKRSC
jgi:serum/glucocorticoid-regulated kinase 2